jgi:hypothetical protein
MTTVRPIAPEIQKGADGGTRTGAIAVGDILIEGGTYLPNSLTTQIESSSTGWSEVKSDRPTFEKDVKDAGWTLFFMAGEIESTVFGSGKKPLQAALKRLTTMVKSQGCNSIEITQVMEKSFLKVPYVSICAHVRHLQKGLSFAASR